MTAVCIDENDPELLAMLQAFYSRSHLSINDRYIDTEATKKSLEKWLIQYGHESIGNCGSTTVFFEDVSMLFAKALQDHQLYNGIETSSRYLDFTERGCYNKVISLDMKQLQDDWMGLYKTAIAIVRLSLHNKYPYLVNDTTLTEKEWDKAINARVFDICRSLLPAGALTKVSISSTFSTTKEQLRKLLNHPLDEVREQAIQASTLLKEKYPSVFVDLTLDKTTVPEEFVYYNPATFSNYFNHSSFDNLSKQEIYFLKNRQRNEKVPKYFDRYATFDLRFLLDFGSFRDIQRHRSALIRMPLLTIKYGFNEWYLDQFKELSTSLYDNVCELIEETVIKLKQLDDYTAPHLQYVIPMGFNVPVNMQVGLASLVYITELRSSRTVHPTLRKVIKQFNICFEDYLLTTNQAIHGIKLYIDEAVDDFVPYRGKQDIVEIANV